MGKTGTRGPLARFMPYIFGGFLLLLLISGGASRPDEPHQILARMAALVVIACAALAVRRDELDRVRAPLLFLLAVAAMIVLQLIPMPPGLWDMLPGRSLYREGFAIAGLEPVWRPLSLTPDRTLNALLALLPAFAAVLGLAFLDRERHRLLAMGLIAAILVAALIGIVQISTGSLYLYRVTNSGAAVGLFANRNHQAVLLASAFPLLAMWMTSPATDRSFEQLRAVLALLMTTLVVGMLLATGSRGGLAAGLVSALASLALLWFAERQRKGQATWRSRLKFVLPLILGGVAVAATMFWSRGVALERLMGEGAEDMRTTLLPLFLQITRDFLPFGAGFGAFDPVFRSYEPYSNLGPAYVNHVHNDYVEVVLEAGLLGAALIALFLAWFAIRTWRLWAARGREAQDGMVQLGRAGSIIVLILLISSAVDYPLRTPLLAFLFTVAAVWMLPARGSRQAVKTKLGSDGPIG